MTLRVLMVCTGNICRSTMAQEVLQEQVEAAGLDVTVDSAGVSDEEHGNPIDPRAARVLREAGHQVPDHRARQVRADELGSWDLVLAMTHRHLTALEGLARRAGTVVTTDAAPGDGGRVDLDMYRAFDPQLRGGRGPVPGGGAGGDGGPGSSRSRRRPDLDVPDPWYGGHEDFVETLEVIERVTPALVDHLRTLADRARP